MPMLFEPPIAWAVVPLLALDFWQAAIPVITIIILVLSQVLGSKENEPVRRAPEQRRQRRPGQGRAGQGGPAGGGPGPQQAPGAEPDPISQEIDEFLRRAGQADQHRPRQEPPKQAPVRRVEPVREGRRAGGGPGRPVVPELVDVEIVEAVAVSEDAQRGRLAEHHLRPSQRPKPADLGNEFYDTLDADNELRDLGAPEVHAPVTIGELDNPLDVGSNRISDDISNPDQKSGTVQLALAEAVAGIFRDPDRTRQAIIAREVLDRPESTR